MFSIKDCFYNCLKRIRFGIFELKICGEKNKTAQCTNHSQMILKQQQKFFFEILIEFLEEQELDG